MKQLNKADNKNIIYPIFEEQKIDSKIIDTLQFDINDTINRNFGEVTKVYTLGKYPFTFIRDTW